MVHALIGLPHVQISCKYANLSVLPIIILNIFTTCSLVYHHRIFLLCLSLPSRLVREMVASTAVAEIDGCHLP
jgi:hypothetical protein